MKKILQALLIVIFLHSSISYGLCSDINKAWINFNNGNFKEAIPIFENLCNRERDKEACIGLGIAYRDGKGKSKDLNKAIELFNPFLDDVYVKFLLAQLYEYDLGTIDSLNKAFSLYKNIGNTEDRNLEIKVNSAFKRLPVYQFLIDFTDHLADLRHGRISHEAFCNLTNNMNLSELPPEIRLSFQAYIPLVQESNLGFLDGFIRGFSNPIQGAKDSYDYLSGTKKRDSEVLYDRFLSALSKYEISPKFYINQNAKLK